MALEFKTKKIQKQLSKLFGTEVTSESLASLEPEIIAKFPIFLEQIDKSYLQMEDRADTAARNLELSSLELDKLNADLTAIMNGLGQGFMLINRNGICSSVYSKSLESFVECVPVGKHLFDLLKRPLDKRQEDNQWLELLFLDRIDFQDMAFVGPKDCPNSKDKKITVDYKDVRTAEGNIRSILVVLTDQTSEVQAKEAAEQKQRYLDSTIQISKNLDKAIDFLEYVEHSASRITAEFAQSTDKNEIKNLIHTIKGGARTFFFEDFNRDLHELENNIDTAPNIAQLARDCMTENNKKIRQDFSFLFHESSERGRTRLVYQNQIKNYISKLQHNPQAMDLFVETVLTVPISSTLRHYLNFIQDLSKALGKKVKPIDLSQGDQFFVLADPYQNVIGNLIHIFQNMLDHGIELPEKRISLGKAEEGQITLQFKNLSVDQKKRIQIIIQDDGSGINPEIIEQIAKERNVLPQGPLTPSQIIQLIFESGLSTRKDVSMTSGRGVGLSSLKAAAEEIGGSVIVESEINKFTRFTITLPLIFTLST